MSLIQGYGQWVEMGKKYRKIHEEMKEVIGDMGGGAVPEREREKEERKCELFGAETSSLQVL